MNHIFKSTDSTDHLAERYADLDACVWWMCVWMMSQLVKTLETSLADQAKEDVKNVYQSPDPLTAAWHAMHIDVILPSPTPACPCITQSLLALNLRAT